MKDFQHSCIAAITTFLMQFHCISVLNPAIANSLVSIITSIIAGVVTGMLSKLISHLINKNNPKIS